MVTFAEAREIAANRYRDTWPGPGTFHVSPDGYEDATHFAVIVGARECLVDNDMEFVEWDAPTRLVSKATGEVTELHWVEELDRLDRMRPVGG